MLLRDVPDAVHCVLFGVVDDRDEPCMGIAYEVELGDGRVRRGETNEHGILRYDDLPDGLHDRQCTVTLLDVDANAWKQVWNSAGSTEAVAVGRRVAPRGLDAVA